MYEFLVVWGGRAQRFFRLLRAGAARLVLDLRAGGPAGAEKEAHIPYRRPATMPGPPSPYPEVIPDAEDADRMWDVLT